MSPFCLAERKTSLSESSSALRIGQVVCIVRTLRRCSRNQSQFESFSASTTEYTRGKSEPFPSTLVAVRRIPAVSDMKIMKCTLIFVFQMGPIQTDEGGQ